MGKQREPFKVGIHWCGGTLIRDGRACVRCLSCDRVKFIEVRHG